MAPTPRTRTIDRQSILDDLQSQFILSKDELQQLTSAFLDEIRQGLNNYGHPMAMIPTFVTGVPDGTETGTFLALDLGGTNLRVCEVELLGDKTFRLRQQKYKVSEQLKTGEATVLFDYLADSVDAFLTSSTTLEPSTDDGIPASLAGPTPYLNGQSSTGNSPDYVHLGLTFSFPVEQTALDSGTLLTWTKGFSARNAVGKDVVKLLQDAFDRKHIHVKCVALVNDTVGAMLSRAYQAGGCLCGAIFGTGTNGAYLENVANISKLGNSAAVSNAGGMVVNTEWGAFNNSRSHLPSTIFDNKLDRESINPRFQAFEKFISGMYLGEITRNVLLHLIDYSPQPVIFGGKSTKEINTHYGLDTAVLSLIETAWGHNPDGEEEELGERIGSLSDERFDGKLGVATRARVERVKNVIVDHMGYKEDDVSLRDAVIFRKVCAMVASRAAQLSGCAVAAIVVQTGKAELGGSTIGTERIPIGVDGSLVEHYPGFELGLRNSLRLLVGSNVERRVEIGMAKDGSGVGAALCALQASKQLS